MKHIFQILVGEALEALSLEELAKYRDELRAVAEKVYAKDAEVIGDLSPASLLEQMKAGVEAIEFANERIATLELPEVTEDELAAELEQMAARTREPEPEAAVEPEPEPEPEAAVAAADEPAEPAAEPEPAAETTEPVAAAEPEPAAEPEVEADPEAEPAEVTAAAPRPPLARPSRSRAAKPAVSENDLATLTASCEGIGFALGEEIPDMVSLAAAMISKRSRFGHMTAREDVPIAMLDYRESYPEERRLSARDGVEANTAKVNALLASLASDPNKGTDDALVAAGGICAPLTPLYELPVFSVADRPVRAALPAFMADRGGIIFATPPTLGDVDSAIGIITSEEDGLGGTSATKTCQVLECPPFVDKAVDILYHCVQTSNLTYRTYPEQLAQFNQLVLAAFARMAERKLLDEIETASTAVTAASLGLGATGDLLGQVLAAAAGMRSRHRMADEAVLRVMLPKWSTALMVSDIIRSQFQRFDTDEAKITALLRTFNVEPSFYKDSSTGGAQIFGSQTAGDLLPFPAEVEWFLFPEGTFLYLDGGTLELGLVRDSVLNSTNEFQVFGESFENVAMLGIESLAITSTVCDSGAVSAPAEISTCGDYS